MGEAGNCPHVFPHHRTPVAAAPVGQSCWTEAAALGSNTLEQVTLSPAPQPRNQTLAENAVEHFSAELQVEKIVINVDKMSLQEEKRARYTLVILK